VRSIGGVADESPEQAKELLRLLVKDIQVHDRRRIIPTYRIPAAVRAIPRKVVLTGQLSNPPEPLARLLVLRTSSIRERSAPLGRTGKPPTRRAEQRRAQHQDCVLTELPPLE
jgi:hypothetical protein